MNNIYKVIWSKAKNCYVVASEIARSHTKSATGSEKIGGVTRRSLLASLMALSLLCGGLGVASAADGTVNVDEATPGTAVVYTTEGTQSYVEGKLGDYYTKDKVDEKLVDLKGDVTTNKNNIGKLQPKTANLSEDGTKLTGMNSVETGALKVTGQISNGADVTTTLTDIKASMDKAKANETAIGELQGTTNGQQTAIDDLKQKTKEISHVDGDGTTISGVRITDGNIVGNGNSAITGLTNVETNSIKTDIINGKNLEGHMVATDKDVEKAVKAETDAREAADTALGQRIDKEIQDRKEADTALEGKINTLKETGVKYDNDVKDTITLAGLDGTKITHLKDATLSDSSNDAVTGKQLYQTNKDLKTEAQTREDMDTLLRNRADALEKNTGGITRNDAKDETYIEKNVTVDNKGNVKANGNVTADGMLKGDGVDAGTGDITTTGAVNAGSLNVTDASTLKGDVTMDKTLKVTGDTSLGKTDVGGALTVTGASDLKGNVILGTDTSNTVTVNGNAHFNAAVNMDKGLTVTNGETKLQKTTVDGDLKVTGTITTDRMVFGDPATGNYTEINKGNITSKNDVLAGDATKKSSSMELNHTKLEVAVADKDSNGHLTMTADQTSIKNSDLDGKNYSEIVADKDSVTTTVKDEKGNTTSTKSKATEIRNYAGDAVGNKTINLQTATQNKSWAKDKDGNESSIVQTGKDITNTAEKGTITNTAQTIVNNATGDMTNTVGGKQTNTIGGNQENTIGGDQTTTVNGDVKEDYKKNLTTIVGGNELHEVTGTKTENVTGKVTENYNGGQETNVTGDKKTTVTGKTTEEYKGGLETTVTGDEKHNVTGNQVNTISGNQTTNVTGDILNTANSITDKVGDHTRVLDGDGITDTVGGSTFKQRIDAIMMESKDVSIKAEETLTNEAKVITNKASEVINNEAININNTATGIITSKASEIKNQADKLISNKVGENTWENMEDGKITTSIKDGTKQNLTESNADGLKHSVTDGTSINASATTATSSAQTIVSGGKANSVITTIDGTQFVNSDAAAPVTGASGAGTVDRTTIKGNTITTGKVTMDYAEVMKDLGVTGKTTTGSLEVKGESKLTGDVTMESNATVEKDLKVKGTTTTKTLKVTENAEVDGTLKVAKKATFEDSVSIAKDLSVGGDVTAKSYKVGDKTYINADGINANNQKITNVAEGSISEGSKDAVNGGQLYTVKNDLEGKVNKVGANAAAMANLHPMEFDPDSKWNIAAAIGNYGSETAAALGAFYRPNDDVMVNLSTAFGTGENMVGGGVSVRLGKSGNKLSREESNALKDQVNDLTARMDALLSVLNPNMSKDFPDVPENHWAYEAVSRLAGNDIVQGYPDGEFHGERTMTRYEMAEIIYNALSRGAEAEKELVEEFKPELQAMAASEKATAERAEG